MKDAPAPFGEAMRILKEMERTVTSAEDLEGLVLRYGFFYGPGTTTPATAPTPTEVRRRRLPVVGKGTRRDVLRPRRRRGRRNRGGGRPRGAPGVYNITDDEPAAMRDWVPVYAAAAGAKPPRRVPVWLARLVAGRPVAEFALSLRGASNEKAKRELGWAPAPPELADRVRGVDGPGR